MSKKATKLRAILENSLDSATKRGLGEVTDSLYMSPYLLRWYIGILFFIFQSGAQDNPEKKLRWIDQLNSTEHPNFSELHEGRRKD